MEIWDRGYYVLTERTLDRIRFSLNGARLTGEYELILTGVNGGRAVAALQEGPPAHMMGTRSGYFAHRNPITPS
jgi:hypothetical protein